MERFNRKRYILCLQYIVRCIATVVFLNFPLTAKQIPETTIIKSNKINKKDVLIFQDVFFIVPFHIYMHPQYYRNIFFVRKFF